MEASPDQGLDLRTCRCTSGATFNSVTHSCGEQVPTSGLLRQVLSGHGQGTCLVGSLLKLKLHCLESIES